MFTLKKMIKKHRDGYKYVGYHNLSGTMDFYKTIAEARIEIANNGGWTVEDIKEYRYYDSWMLDKLSEYILSHIEGTGYQVLSDIICDSDYFDGLSLGDLMALGQIIKSANLEETQ